MAGESNMTKADNLERMIYEIAKSGRYPREDLATAFRAAIREESISWRDSYTKALQLQSETALKISKEIGELQQRVEELEKRMEHTRSQVAMFHGGKPLGTLLRKESEASDEQQ